MGRRFVGRIMFWLLPIFFLSWISSYAEGFSDFQRDINSANTGTQVVCASEYGYYVHDGLYLYYIEKDTMVGTYACARIECQHNTEDCSAYLPEMIVNLSFNNGRIFYCVRDERDVVLHSMAQDGTRRVKLCKIGDVEYNNEGKYIIHRDYIYYLWGNELFRVPVDYADSGEVERVGVISNEVERWYDADAFEDSVWFRIRNSVGTEEIYQYNIKTGIFSVAWTKPEGRVSNGVKVFQDEVRYFISGTGLFSNSLFSQTGGSTKVFDVTQRGYGMMLDTYLFIDSGYPMLSDESSENFALYVYDMTGKYVRKYPYGECLYDGVYEYLTPIAFDGELILWEGREKESTSIEFPGAYYIFQQADYFYTSLRVEADDLVHIPIR